MTDVTWLADPRLAIAIGDPNGVGPEIAVRAALALHARRGLRALLVAENFIIDHTCRLLGVDSVHRKAFEVRHVGALAPAEWQPGYVTASAGAATVAYVREAVALAQAGQVAAIAAAPHSETAVNSAGISFSGYSGLVADCTGTPRERTFLMLQAQGLRVTHATLHESVRSALVRLTPGHVQAAAEATHNMLARMGVSTPRLCVLGINPHAGEGGLFGDEDEQVTRPAVAALRARGWDVQGPVGADLALSERACDAYIAMFHDQGHIAVKMLSPKGATAWVAGTPVLFASVGHGAAFDIAGRGTADASALTETVLLLSNPAL